MDRLRKFFALPSDQRAALLAALAGLPLMAAAIYLLGYKRVRRLLAGAETLPVERSESNRVQAERVARAVRLAALHGLARGTCLSRSMLLWRMLERRGIPAEVRFGVRNGENGMEAHAWVEQDGHSLDDFFEDHSFADLKPARSEDASRP